MSTSSLGVFLKVPRPGRVKTRLARSLGDASATSLYAAFLRDTVTFASAHPSRHLHFFVEGGTVEQALGEVWTSLRAERPGRVSEHPQCDGNLGARLADAFARANALAPAPLLMIGSDSPDLPATHLGSALDALDAEAEVVLGDTADGGVWCIGLAQPFPDFFEELPWSSADTGQALLRRAAALKLGHFRAQAWYDCDELSDLGALAGRLQRSPHGAAATRAWIAAHVDQLPFPRRSENS